MAVPVFQARARSRISNDRAVATWLWSVATLVFGMIVVGGATRLTDSGLSITEWKPILGAIPPLSSGDWAIAFEKYRQIPEYQLINKGMSLEAFKVIYWWEWGHRFLGRLIGLAFALPLVWFWLTDRLRPGLAPRLLGILALGGLQGLIGWYMVQSGLVDRVDVSQYRLALHLTVAFVILALLVWVALSLRDTIGNSTVTPVMDLYQWFAVGLVSLIMLQVVLGAFVAGLKAGLTYNTWPLMDGRFIPTGLGMLEPWYINATENVTTVQFNHRMMAYLIVVLALVHAVMEWRRTGPAKATSACLLAGAVLLQAGIGIWTLLAHVPLSLGLMHQGGAAILLVVAVWHLHRSLARPSSG